MDIDAIGPRLTKVETDLKKVFEHLGRLGVDVTAETLSQEERIAMANGEKPEALKSKSVSRAEFDDLAEQVRKIGDFHAGEPVLIDPPNPSGVREAMSAQNQAPVSDGINGRPTVSGGSLPERAAAAEALDGDRSKVEGDLHVTGTMKPDTSGSK